MNKTLAPPSPPVQEAPPGPPVQGGSSTRGKDGGRFFRNELLATASSISCEKEQNPTAKWVPSPPFTGGLGGASFTGRLTRAALRLPIWIITLVGCCFLLSAKQTGCKRQKESTVATPATETRSVNYLTKKLQGKDDADVQRLNAKARIFVEGDGQSIEANANLIWVRDSALWLNVRKFGIEAARALITPDSVFVLNRLSKTYTARGLESLQLEYNLPAGFDLLQAVILAKAWILPGVVLKSDLQDGLHRLSGSDAHYGVDYRLEEGSFLLRHESFLQAKDQRSVVLDFDQYKKLPGAGLFPYLRQVSAFSPETGQMQINLELSEVEINVPKPIRFEIPSHYQRTR